MGLGLQTQSEYYNSLSTGIIKIGDDEDDPLANLTFNDDLAITSATQVLTTRVNFEVLSHNLTTGQNFTPIGSTPAAYNGVFGDFTVDNVVDSDNVEVILLSDPGGDATVVGTYDDGTFNITLPGIFRVVDRVNDSNGTPANNQFSKTRSRMFSYNAAFNIDHTAVGTDGTFPVIVDQAGVVSVIALASGLASLPVTTIIGEPTLNTHISVGFITKADGSTTGDLSESIIRSNDNPYNRIRNITFAMSVINSIDSPIAISPIAGTIQISTNAGITFTPIDVGYGPTGGLNPNQFQTPATSPTTIITGDRLGSGSIVNISASINVNEFESSPGVFTAKGPNNVSNNTIIGFSGGFDAEFLGQKLYSGGTVATRLAAAVAANEKADISNIAIFGVKISQISIDTGATDLSLTTQAIFTDSKQFR